MQEDKNQIRTKKDSASTRQNEVTRITKMHTDMKPSEQQVPSALLNSARCLFKLPWVLPSTIECGGQKIRNIIPPPIIFIYLYSITCPKPFSGRYIVYPQRTPTLSQRSRCFEEFFHGAGVFFRAVLGLEWKLASSINGWSSQLWGSVVGFNKQPERC